MSPSSTRHDWTYAEYARFPDDGNRYEVLDGQVLVTPGPSPRHQHVLGSLYVRLRAYVEAGGLGIVLTDVDLLFQPGQFLRPDLLFLREASREGITDRGIEDVPGLIVEIQSPTSGNLDRVKKPARYSDFGVPEYWVLDPGERVVWAWRFSEGAVEPERITDRLEWHPVGADEPLTIDLDELFRPI